MTLPPHSLLLCLPTLLLHLPLIVSLYRYKCTLIVKLCLDVIYIAVLSATACSWLDEMLDWDHHGVNSDLYSIAEHMVDWEEKLAALL